MGAAGGVLPQAQVTGTCRWWGGTHLLTLAERAAPGLPGNEMAALPLETAEL